MQPTSWFKTFLSVGFPFNPWQSLPTGEIKTNNNVHCVFFFQAYETMLVILKLEKKWKPSNQLWQIQTYSVHMTSIGHLVILGEGFLSWSPWGFFFVYFPCSRVVPLPMQQSKDSGHILIHVDALFYNGFILFSNKSPAPFYFCHYPYISSALENTLQAVPQ